MKAKIVLPMIFSIIFILGTTPQAFAVPVDSELQLLVDVSGSVDAGEFILQRDGWANAFISPAVTAVINNPAFGGVCVQLVYWSSSNQQQIAVDWTVVQNPTDAQTLSNAIMAAPRPFSGGTQPDAAINFGFPLFTNNGCEGATLVIDVSGDGTGNAINTAAARDAALAAGINRINGLVIGTNAFVLAFYVDNIQGGMGSFTDQVANFADFTVAAEKKIMVEFQPDNGVLIGGTIIPIDTTSLLLVGAQLTAAWMIPVIIAGIGIAIVIARKF